ncbi:MAG: hypothetical protein N3I86_01480 [Verrucomicrobiae bacterium]|nr:hypothetical protein [Verrucomicrobiae bacterium]
MKTRSRSLPVLVVVCGLLVWTSGVQAADSARRSHVPGQAYADAVSTLTGVAISPLLGASAYGAVKYFRTPADQRAKLPWFAQPWFWVPALLLVAAVFVKDSAGTALPTALKKPFDVLEALENKISGLIATGAFAPLIILMMNDAATSASHGLSHAGMAAVDLTWLQNLLLVPAGMMAFFVVFLASHAINILILLSPFTTVDAALKAFRVTLLGTVVGSAWVNPWLGALWALLLIILAAGIAGWSFRLSHFGLVFIWDFFTRRHKRFRPDPTANPVFLGRRLQRVPTRTYGRLTRNAEGRLVFTYRPWLVLPPRALQLPEGRYAPGRGLFYSEVMRLEGDDAKTVLLLPPRYRGHETELKRIYALEPARDVGLRAAWKWLRELFVGRPQPAAA